MRDLSSRAYKRMMEWLTGNPNLRYVNSFRLIRGSIARGAANACPNDIYFDVMLSWFTNRIKPVLWICATNGWHRRRAAVATMTALADVGSC